MKKVLSTILCSVVGLIFISADVLAQDLKPITLPKPKMEGGKPIMEVFKDRRSTKAYAPQPIAPEILSDMLWAANGINRPATGGRTAPSALNSQNIDTYVLLPEGVYLYDPKAHALTPVLAEDLRPLSAGPQAYAREAPLHLLHVADLAKLARVPDPARRVIFSAMNANAVTQNVELYCAAVGLGAATRATMDAPGLHKKLKLRDDQEIMLNQTIGYPKK